jgi:hypothetical protein
VEEFCLAFCAFDIFGSDKSNVWRRRNHFVTRSNDSLSGPIHVPLRQPVIKIYILIIIQCWVPKSKFSVECGCRFPVSSFFLWTFGWHPASLFQGVGGWGHLLPSSWKQQDVEIMPIFSCVGCVSPLGEGSFLPIPASTHFAGQTNQWHDPMIVCPDQFMFPFANP